MLDGKGDAWSTRSAGRNLRCNCADTCTKIHVGTVTLIGIDVFELSAFCEANLKPALLTSGETLLLNAGRNGASVDTRPNRRLVGARLNVCEKYIHAQRRQARYFCGLVTLINLPLFPCSHAIVSLNICTHLGTF